MGQPNTVSGVSEDASEALTSATKMLDAQTYNVLCKHLKKILRKNRPKAVSGDGLLCKKVPIHGPVQIIGFDRYIKSLPYHEHRRTSA